MNRSAAQADPEAALRALAKSRSLRRLARDVGALKRRARGRERAEVHRGSQKGSSSALTERRSAEEHFGRSAAAQAAEEAAQLASLGPATLGPPKRARESAAQKQRRRLRRRLRLSGKLQESADSDEQLREDAALSAFVGREWNEGVSTPGLPAPLRVTAPRKSAARALFSEHLLASCAYTTGGPRLLFRLRREKEGRVRPARSLSPILWTATALVGSSSPRSKAPAPLRLVCLTPRTARLGCALRSVRPITFVPSSVSFAHEPACSKSWFVATPTPSLATGLP